MGRASRKKKDTVELRHKEKRCLHCGGPREEHIWCRRCVINARRRGREHHYPTIKPPITRANQHLYHWLRQNFWNIDPRYRWPMMYVCECHGQWHTPNVICVPEFSCPGCW